MKEVGRDEKPFQLGLQPEGLLLKTLGSKADKRLQVRNMGVSENRGPKHNTLNSRILIIRTPK